MRRVRHRTADRRGAAGADRGAARAAMPPCWSRRPAPARPRACRWCCSTSRGRRTARSSCWSRAGSRRAPPPTRMAATLGEQVGETVGLRVRFGSKVVGARPASRSSPKACSRGMILDDPALEGVAAVLFDEFHERSLDADLGLALARDAQQGLREDLQAPGDVGDARRRARRGAARRRAGDRERGPRLPGRDALSRPRSDARASRSRSPTRSRARCAPSRARCWCSCRAQAKSAAPRRCCASASPIRRSTSSPLYGALDAATQDRAIAPAPPGRRKVVLATSIAETSLTIEGVRVVVDCGPGARAALRAGRRPDAARDRARLARRRRPAPRPRRPHRAGRLLPAVGRAADRLARSLRAAGDPRRPTSRGFVLDLAAWGVARPATLAFLDPPPQPALAEARALLAELGALDATAASPTTASALRRAAAAAAARPHGGRRGARRRRRSCAADIAAVLTERGLGGDDVDLDAPPRALPPRPLAPRARTRGAMAKRWAETAGGARAGARRSSCRPAPSSRSPIRTASPRAAAAAALPARQRPRRAMSIRRRRWRASRSSRSPRSPARAAQGRILLAAPITLAEIEARFADRIEAATRSRFDAATREPARAARCAGSAPSRWREQTRAVEPDRRDRAACSRERHRARSASTGCPGARR